MSLRALAETSIQQLVVLALVCKETALSVQESTENRSYSKHCERDRLYMIVGIPAMQIPLDSHASHPSPESSGATPTATAPYDSTSQMHPLGMPPQQVYLSGEMTDMGALAHQFQALGMPTQQQPPQAGDSEIGDDNDGTTETEEDPVKLFVGQVS